MTLFRWNEWGGQNQNEEAELKTDEASSQADKAS